MLRTKKLLAFAGHESPQMHYPMFSEVQKADNQDYETPFAKGGERQKKTLW